MWATCEYSGYVLGDVHSVGVPDDFLKAVLEATAAGGLDFVVVDVGRVRDGAWCIVEANPPFALSSYSLSMDIYVGYCCAAWASLLQRVKEP